MRMEDLVTILPREMTATSLVPPPTSTTIDPWASLTGRFVPMAAASGSSVLYAWGGPPAPARPLGLVDGEVRTYGSSQRLLDCVRLAGPRRLGRLLDCPELDTRHA